VVLHNLQFWIFPQTKLAHFHKEKGGTGKKYPQRVMMSMFSYRIKRKSSIILKADISESYIYEVIRSPNYIIGG
jgi:hypothetical protein